MKTKAKGLWFNINLKLTMFIFIFFILIFNSNSLADETEASSAVVVDGQTGKILYAKNPYLKLPPASTTKLVTAMVVLDKLEPERKVTISHRAAKTHSVEPKLQEGEVYTVHDLLYLALMRSVNSAAVSLAEAVSGSEENFVKLMNEKTKKIGAKDTKFINASGLPGHGQYTTVHDLTKIMSHALSYPIIREALNTRVYIVRSEDGKEHFIQNTNQLLWSEENMIGGKTGYTGRARHCFVCASKIENRLVYTAVLGVPNREKLWRDTQMLLSKADGVLSGKNEPVIQFTTVKPLLKVSYKKIKYADRSKMSNKTKEKQDIKTNKTKNKKYKTKRNVNAKVNRQSI